MSGILTERELKSPTMALSPVSVEYAVFMYVEVKTSGPLIKGPPLWCVSDMCSSLQ